MIVCSNIRVHYFISCSIFFQIIEYALPPARFECRTKLHVKRYKGFSENKYLKSWLVVQNLRIVLLKCLYLGSFSSDTCQEESSECRA